MGAVYRAFDPHLCREVALKIHLEDDPASQARAMREARALARLDHENVVAVHEVGTEGRAVYVVMELLEGRPLPRWLADERPGMVGTLRVFAAIAAGLGDAHRHGLVHRDVKPDNVIVTDDDRVVVVDFGLARPVTVGPGTAPGDFHPSFLAGTPAYMAPEQHLGRPLDARCDQFSLAVSLWEALFGKRPFEGETVMELAVAVSAGELQVPAPSWRVPAELLLALVRALRREPGDRFADLDQLRRVLLRVIDDRESIRPNLGVAAAVLTCGAALTTAATIGGAIGHGVLVMAVVIGFCALVTLHALTIPFLPRGSMIERWISPAAHALVPGLLLSALIGELGFATATASWFPPIFAIGVFATLVHPTPRRMWLQVLVTSGSLLAAWWLWYVVELSSGAAVPVHATPAAMALRIGGVLLLAYVLTGQARRLARQLRIHSDR